MRDLMEVFASVVLAVAPDLALIALGAVIGGLVASEVWGGLDRLNFAVLFPALLFVAAASRPIAPNDALIVGTAVWAVMALGCLLGWFARPLGPTRFLDFAGAWQTAWRFNTAIAFVAVGAMEPRAAALMSIAIGFGVPVANVLAVGALSRGNGLGLAASVRRIALNPFLLASLAGLLVGLSGRAVPGPVEAGLVRLADAAVPLALLSIGATLDRRALAAITRFDLVLNAIKLLALPLAALSAGRLIGLSPSHLAVITVFAALPTASAAHVLASVFGADRAHAARLIAQSTVIGCVTLPAWIALVR